jgi:hypothetical protein
MVRLFTCIIYHLESGVVINQSTLWCKERPPLVCLAVSYCVVACLVVSCRIVSCRVLSCLVLSCRVLSCPVLSCRVLFSLVASCLVLSLSSCSCLVLRYQEDVGVHPWIPFDSSEESHLLIRGFLLIHGRFLLIHG